MEDLQGVGENHKVQCESRGKKKWESVARWQHMGILAKCSSDGANGTQSHMWRDLFTSWTTHGNTRSDASDTFAQRNRTAEVNDHNWRAG